jgi:hypothetical protein
MMSSHKAEISLRVQKCFEIERKEREDLERKYALWGFDEYGDHTDRDWFPNDFEDYMEEEEVPG